ncbi:MAG: endonuclease I [Armatimonadetes bacterium]|nr:endonuclease I [Armatimonadota bacterium]
MQALGPLGRSVPAAAARHAPAQEEVPRDTVEIHAPGARPYYDAARDAADAARYYGKLRQDRPLLSQLSRLLKDTHTRVLAYEPSKYLYPWVDRRPDGTLAGIYSGQPVSGMSAADQASGWTAAGLAAPLDAMSAAAAVAVRQNAYSCEHVVARDWFHDKQPMRGDLHYLFTCGSADNSARGHSPLGPRHGFVPSAGRGAVARATFYFLVRYPHKVDRYSVEDLKALLKWHREDPVSDYERHRNAAIAVLQGNRNPFVDHPEWAERLDLERM